MAVTEPDAAKTNNNNGLKSKGKEEEQKNILATQPPKRCRGEGSPLRHCFRIEG